MNRGLRARLNYRAITKERQEMARSVEHGTFSLGRQYAHAPAKVFSAFSDPGAKAQWFGPADMKGGGTLDFRVGGQERMIVKVPDGPTYEFIGLYQDIVPDERIIYSYEMTMDGTRISVSVTTLEFIATGAGTNLKITEQGAFLDGLDNNATRQQGTEELLQELATYLDRGTS
jgi:uncharacterized protein YndB with AHSA1/START domain